MPRHGKKLVPYADRDDSGILAIPLKQVSGDRSTAQAAVDRGMGIAYRGQAWINQLPEGHHARTKAFQALGYAAQDGPIDNGSRWSEDFVRELAGRYVDAQIGSGGTLISSPAHYVAKGAAYARENELRLVEASISEFGERQGSRPAIGQVHGRTLFAAMVVKSAHLASAAEDLIPLYKDFEVDGFWIDVEGFDDASVRHLRGLSRLAFGLQQASGLPVVVAVVGAAHFAFLASGLAGTSIGHHAQGIKYPPPALPVAEPSRKNDGLGIHTFHRAVYANLQLGPKGRQQARSLFKRVPCHCGFHAPSVPPTEQKQIKGHNLISILSEVDRVGLREPAVVREERLARRIERAAKTRKLVGINKDLRPWLVVSEVARQIRDSGEWRQEAEA